MRFARVVSAYDCYNPNIMRLVEKADLDVLQLDYRWPSVVTRAENSRSNPATGFHMQLRSLQKTLFLDPELRVITNAGGGDTPRCVESLAAYLCEHGSSEMLITSIRGDNLFDRLEELMAEGIELRDVSTHKTLHELTNPLLSAHIELGGGPIKTALAEDSSIVVMGCYDRAAPLLAAANHGSGLTWEHYDTLARLAFASSFDESVVQFEEPSGIDIDHRLSTAPTAGTHARAIPRTEFADVHCSFSGHEPSDLTDLQGIRGAEATGNWLLRVEYLASHTVSALLEPAEEHAQELVVQLRDTMTNNDHAQSRCEVTAFQLEQAADRRIQVLANCQELKAAELLLTELQNWIARHVDRGLLKNATVPLVQDEVADFCSAVPRDAIAISVDTRPAKEWR